MIQTHTRILLAGLVILMFFTGGCSLTPDNPYKVRPITTTLLVSGEIETNTGVRQINPQLYTVSPYRKTDQNGKLAQTNEIYETYRPLYEIAAGVSPATDTITRKEARDRLQLKLMELSDRATIIHLAGVLAVEDALNLTTGLGALTFDALATALSASSTKTAMSATSGLFTGARGLINEEVYHNAFGPAIVKVIEQDRRKFAIELQKKRIKLDISKYSIEEALMDVNHFHHLGSFYHGLTLLQKETYRVIDEQEGENDGEQKNVERLLAQSEATRKLNEVLEAIQKLDPPTQKNIYEQAAAAMGEVFSGNFTKMKAINDNDAIAFSMASGTLYSNKPEERENNQALLAQRLQSAYDLHKPETPDAGGDDDAGDAPSEGDNENS